MSTKNKLKRNITVSYIYNFLLKIDITTAIWVLYLSFRGMSLVEIGLIESVYHITGILFELPTGAIADVYGKKFSVLLGRILSVISCLLMITASSFWGFAIAFMLASASMNLNSGAAEALVYDSLKILGRGKIQENMGESCLCYVHCTRIGSIGRRNIIRHKIFICIYFWNNTSNGSININLWIS
jgi:MFS family permease